MVINQTMLLDTSTPRLSFLLIKGGQLIFDRKDGLHLQVLFTFVQSGVDLKLRNDNTKKSIAYYIKK